MSTSGQYHRAIYITKGFLLSLQGLLFALYADSANDSGIDSLTAERFSTAEFAQVLPLCVYLFLELTHVLYMGVALCTKGPASSYVREAWSNGVSRGTAAALFRLAYILQPILHSVAALLVVLYWSGGLDELSWWFVATLVLFPFGIASVACVVELNKRQQIQTSLLWGKAV